jgi:outer membrane protein assembly factor BamA
MKTICVMALLLAMPGYCAAQAIEVPKLIAQEVQCRGNQRTSCEFIRSHVHVKAGDVLNEDEIINAELRLSSLRLFESVSVHLEKGGQRDTAIIVVEVTEADPITTELLVGASARLESVRSVFAARLAHQNLFDAGKIADITAVAITPLGGDAVVETYGIALRYADPNLFGSSKYFAIASVSWQNDRRRDVHGNFSDFEGLQLDVRVGRRFADFSYFTLGLSYRPDLDWTYGAWKADEVFEINVPDNNFGLNTVYGWNSEDDLYFPTTGSSFHIGAGWDFGQGSPEHRSHVQFRKTWPLSNGFLAVKVGGGPSPEYRTTFEESQLLAVSYARPLQNNDSFVRGRWYVEPGFGWSGRSPDGEVVYEVGIKAGIRLDMTGWGIVDLYVIGSQDPSR